MITMRAWLLRNQATQKNLISTAGTCPEYIASNMAKQEMSQVAS